MQKTPEKILSQKADFTACVDGVRMQIQNKALLEDKWLRPSDDLFQWYYSEFSRAQIPRESEVFDLGAGPGYFMWFLRKFSGCNVRGIDSQPREDYRMLWQSLKLDGRILIQSIQRFTRIDFYLSKYDYITALGICFDRIGNDSEKLWGIEEFTFFLNDACQNLKPNGVIYLRFNRQPVGRLFEFFKSLDAHEGDTRFRITREKYLESSHAKPCS